MSETPEKDLSIQNDFFNQARKARTRVAIFLTSGKRLSGRIKAFDRFTIILDAGGGVDEMVFKHAIATISAAPRVMGSDSRSDARGRQDAPREPSPVTAQEGPSTPTPIPSLPVPGGPVKG